MLRVLFIPAIGLEGVAEVFAELDLIATRGDGFAMVGSNDLLTGT